MIKGQEVRQRKRRRTRAEIQQIVNEFKGGELTQAEFCRRHDLVLSTLGRYLRQERDSSEARPRVLVAVEVAAKKLGAQPAGCGLSVMLGSGRQIVIEADFDGATLQRVVQVLERMQP
jgi:transposase-like protein